jgi:NAD(P)-dependent dehydrogenase (short-subunit alcohol dehydrogenase family)
MAMQIDLSGKTILACGAGPGGIAQATVETLVKAGAAVIALDYDADLMERTVTSARALGGTVHPMVVDLTDPAQVERVIARIWEEHGALDGIANVAGGTRAEEWMPLDMTPTDSFRQTLALNFEYIFMLCRDAAKEWIARERGGAVVNVSSVSSLASAPWHGPYGAAKSATVALTKTMANEWHEFGIRANAVLPGAVATERVMSRISPDNVIPGSEQNFTEPQELANAIVFLLSDLANGISGQAIAVDRSLSTKFCAGARRSRKEMERD